jgi:hypothetical protein
MSLFLRTVLVFALMSEAIPATELSGIWAGLAPGRHEAKEDVAFQFKIKDRTLTGRLFGDEFDLPIADAYVVGNKVHFSVTTINYYSGAKIKFVYTGTIAGHGMELTRERTLTPGEDPPKDETLKQTFTLKKLTP